MNAQQYSRGGDVRYTYQAAASVSSFSPASEALGYLLCRIGGAVRRARWASPTALVCNTTRAAAGEAVVEVSNNGREYTGDGVAVRLVSARVQDVQPWSGPQLGST